MCLLRRDIRYFQQYGLHELQPNRDTVGHRGQARLICDGNKWDVDQFDDTHEGVFYQRYETQYFGFGGGDRWQWSSGWNVTASMALHYRDDEYLNPEQVVSDTEVLLHPGINVGYRF